MKLQKPRHENWSVPVLSISALKSKGIDEVWEEILNLKSHLHSNNIFIQNRSSQDEKWQKKKKKNLIISMMESEDEILEKIEKKIIESDKQLLKKFTDWIKSIFKSRNS